MVSSVENPHGDPYQRALHDPQFLAAVREQYRGRWPVLDALWWATHPIDAAPSGRPAPVAQVRDLQRRVFAADADAVGDPAVAKALRELEAEIARERTAIDAAIASASIGESRSRAAAPPPDPVAAVPAEPAALRSEPAALHDIPGPAAAPRAGKRRLRQRQAAYLTVAVLVGVVAGGQLAEATSRTGTPASPNAPAALVAGGTAPALKIFDRTQVMTDVPGVPVPPSFHRTTFRAAGRVTWEPGGPQTESPYYVVKADGERVCLLLMVDKVHYLSTCVSTAEFAATGMRLLWTSDLPFGTDGLSASPGPQNFHLEWTPDGTFGVGSAATAAPAPG